MQGGDGFRRRWMGEGEARAEEGGGGRVRMKSEEGDDEEDVAVGGGGGGRVGIGGVTTPPDAEGER